MLPMSPYALLLVAVAVVGAFVAIAAVAVAFRWTRRQLATRSAPAVARESAPEPDPEQELVQGRRRFLTAISVAFGGMGAAIVGVPVIGVLFSPVRQDDPEVWRPVGPVDDFPVGDTVHVDILDPNPEPWAGIAARRAAWLRRVSEQEFTVFSGYCTHVGCPVRWEATAELFMCPCHGGAFDRDGSVAAGPPPEPLPRYPWRVRNGQVEIRTQPVPLPDQEEGRS